MYEVRITNLVSDITEIFGPFNHSYAKDTAVKIIFANDRFYEGQQYRVIVTVQTGGTEVTSSPYIFSMLPIINTCTRIACMRFIAQAMLTLFYKCMSINYPANLWEL